MFTSAAVLSPGGWKIVLAVQSLLAASGIKFIHICKKNAEGPLSSTLPSSLCDHFRPEYSSLPVHRQLKMSGSAFLVRPESPESVLERYMREAVDGTRLSHQKIFKDIQRLFPRGFCTMAFIIPLPYRIQDRAVGGSFVRDFFKSGSRNLWVFPAVFFLTEDLFPVGMSWGWGLELQEVVRTLQAESSFGLLKLSIETAAEILLLSRETLNRNEAKILCKKALLSGKALDVFFKIFPQFRNIINMPSSGRTSIDCPLRVVRSVQSGFFHEINRHVFLEARKRIYERTSNSFKAEGISFLKKSGDRVEKGEPLVEVFGQCLTEPVLPDAMLRQMFSIRRQKPEFKPLISHKITAGLQGREK